MNHVSAKKTRSALLEHVLTDYYMPSTEIYVTRET